MQGHFYGVSASAGRRDYVGRAARLGVDGTVWKVGIGGLCHARAPCRHRPRHVSVRWPPRSSGLAREVTGSEGGARYMQRAEVLKGAKGGPFVSHLRPHVAGTPSYVVMQRYVTPDGPTHQTRKRESRGMNHRKWARGARSSGLPADARGFSGKPRELSRGRLLMHSNLRKPRPVMEKRTSQDTRGCSTRQPRDFTLGGCIAGTCSGQSSAGMSVIISITSGGSPLDSSVSPPAQPHHGRF